VRTGVPTFVNVTNRWKREPGFEYVKDQPYTTTTVAHVTIHRGVRVQEVTVDRPAPGTPPDARYPHPTAPDAAHPYAYTVANADYPKPRSVYRPFFDAVSPKRISPGKALTFVVQARSLADGVRLRYSATRLPRGATFDPATRMFAWTPEPSQTGTVTVRFVTDDGLIPVTRDVVIVVTARGR
jgi:hypothetical protein